jgi:hypothetical protein
LSNIPSGIVSSSTQIPSLLPNGTVSASSQVSHNSTTGYVANEHINHTSVSITAGNGLTGGGDISTTRTITLDTGSIHFVSGSIVNVLNPKAVVSSSAQVSYTGLSNIPSGIVSSSTQIPALLPNGTVSASSQVSFTSISDRPSGLVSSSTQIPALLPAGTVSASSQVNYTSLSSIPSGIVSSSTQIPALLPNGTISSSGQVAHNSTTGYVANEHINHTSVSITAGSGMSGGGDISTTRTLTLDTGSTHFQNGVLTRINSAGVYSSSAQLPVSTYTNAANTRLLASTGTGGITGLSNILYDGTNLIVSGNVDISAAGYPGFRMFVGSTQKAELVWGDPFNRLYFQTFVSNNEFAYTRN